MFIPIEIDLNTIREERLKVSYNEVPIPKDHCQWNGNAFNASDTSILKSNLYCLDRRDVAWCHMNAENFQSSPFFGALRMRSLDDSHKVFQYKIQVIRGEGKRIFTFISTFPDNEQNKIFRYRRIGALVSAHGEFLTSVDMASQTCFN